MTNAISSNQTSAVMPVANQTQETPEASSKVQKIECPGHTEFFHRYMAVRKANRKGNKEVQRREKQDNIKHAEYLLLSKKTPEGKYSGLFNGLNNIYNYAVKIVFYHVDNCKDCSFHPEFKK